VSTTLTPEKWLDTDEVIYVLNTIITPAQR
jgi:hypothetical protein